MPQLARSNSLLPLAAVLLLSAAAAAQTPAATPDQTTGVSHPETLGDTIDATQPPTPPQQYSDHYVKPSPAVPYTPATATTTTPAQQPELQVRPPNDPDRGIVVDVPVGPNEMAIGTRIHAYLQTPISTRITPAGAHFTAAIQSDILRGTHVLVPAGTLISGRITQIHGGRRIRGASSIRLQPDDLILPDRTLVRLNAEVVDVDHFQDSHVNGEGAIVQNTHNTSTAIVGGALTGTAVIAGAIVGGGVGAVVGLAVGAGAGTVLWLKQDRQQSLPEGTEIVFALDEPLTLTPAH